MESVGEGVGRVRTSEELKTCPLCQCETVPGTYSAAYKAVMYICRCTYRWTEPVLQVAEGVQTAGNDEI